MDTLKSFSTKRPVLFVLISVVVWFIVMMLFAGITADILQKPYDDAKPSILGRTFVVICGILLTFKLGWLEAARIARPGRGQVWLFAPGGLVCCLLLFMEAPRLMPRS